MAAFLSMASSTSVALYERPDDPGALWFERHEAVRVDEGQFTIFLFSQVISILRTLGLRLFTWALQSTMKPNCNHVGAGAFARSRVFQALMCAST